MGCLTALHRRRKNILWIHPSRTSRTASTPPMSSGCSRSRLGLARARILTTGRNARSCILARTRVVGIRGSSTIAVFPARTFAKALAGVGISASTRTGCSSAGFTRRSTARGSAKMALDARDVFVFLPTPTKSSVRCSCPLGLLFLPRDLPWIWLLP